ncbi:MAG: glycosyltransferase family 2 protein [Magnetococcales bacterium]|nr:glycosyltransferase family 2 protein [Magnetococcales bacterium]
MKFCSVIITIFNEYENLENLYAALCDLAESEPQLMWEFVLVNDGSTDDTHTLLQQFSARDARFKVVSLSRNFGAHVAETAGLHFCSGDVAVLTVADLQDHPKEIARMLEEWRHGADVVWGVRSSRADHWMSVFTSTVFANIIRRIALPQYPPTGSGGFVLIDRKVIEALKSCPERNRINSGLIMRAGFRQTSIKYDHLARKAGRSKWTTMKKVRLFIDTVVSFSSFPIRFISVTGLAVAVLSAFYAIFLIINRLVYDSIVPGWTTILLVMLILNGVQLTFLGVLGEYLWRSLDDSRRRPLFFVQEVIGDFPRLKIPSLNTGLPVYQAEDAATPKSGQGDHG